MYAIVEIAGQQHKVQKDQKLYVNRLQATEGANVEFEKVLLTDRDGSIAVGIPFVDGARVAARVVAHVKDDKIHIFKHKRRKGYRRFNGHRQPLTELLIQGILAKGETFVPEPEIAAEVPPQSDENLQQENLAGDAAATEAAPAKVKKAAKKKSGKTED